MSITTLVLLAVAVQYVVRRLLVLQHIYRIAPSIPHVWCLFQPMTPIGASLPGFSWNPGLYFTWNNKRTFYKKMKSEAVLFVPLLTGGPTIYTCSPELIQEILGYDSTFFKSKVAQLGVGDFGPNVIASDGPQWRRHRKITAPAFDQKTYELVWDEVVRLYGELVTVEGWKNRDSVTIPDFNHYTTKLALCVISACGFNERFSWADEHNMKGQDISIHDTMGDVSKLMVAHAVIPSWAYYLPIKGLRHIKDVYDRFEAAMRHKIRLRKQEVQNDLDDAQSTGDVFTRLIYASNSKNDHDSLSDSEVLGNCFAFLLAGHETTAHSMALVAAFLGLYPEEQSKVYETVKTVTLDGRDPTIGDYTDLAPVLYCFYEALRLYPSGYIGLRDASEDTIFSMAAISEDKQDSKLTVSKDTAVVLDIIGANRNPRHFENPHEYIPSRWIDGASPFLGFSSGPRSCLGKKFATTEAVCFLTLLLRDWKIEAVMNENESREQWIERVMYIKLGATLTTGDIPLKLTRRK